MHPRPIWDQTGLSCSHNVHSVSTCYLRSHRREGWTLSLSRIRASQTRDGSFWLLHGGGATDAEDGPRSRRSSGGWSNERNDWQSLTKWFLRSWSSQMQRPAIDTVVEFQACINIAKDMIFLMIFIYRNSSNQTEGLWCLLSTKGEQKYYIKFEHDIVQKYFSR